MFDFMMDEFTQTDDGAIARPMVPSPMECMSCGVCLKNCPTYQLSKDEKESPRQRIRTLSKLVLEAANVDNDTIEHLNNCLQCRACEAVCPSQMSYAELFDKAQHQLGEHQSKSMYAKFALHLIENKRHLKRLLPLLSVYHLSGMRWWARQSGLVKLLKLNHAERLARPPVRDALSTFYPVAAAKGTLALFTGCISEAFDRTTLESAIQVLNALGYAVSVPPQQVCCGAIHYHNGEPAMAKQLMQKNRGCFNQAEFEAVIYCATGCGSQLKEYDLALELEENETAFQIPVFEIMDFVARHWDERLQLKACQKKLALHEACSQRNVLKNQQASYDVLAKIPYLQVESLAENHSSSRPHQNPVKIAHSYPPKRNRSDKPCQENYPPHHPVKT